MIKKTYRVEGMHCTSCAAVIEMDVEDAGIKGSVSYAKGTLEAEYDPEKISDQQISEIVKKAGYTLNSYK